MFVHSLVDTGVASILVIIESYYKHPCTGFCGNISLHFTRVKYLRVGLLGKFIFNFIRNCLNSFPKRLVCASFQSH